MALFLGTVYVLVFVWYQRLINKPAPFQLVLRLVNDRGGDENDRRTLDQLMKRFKSLSKSQRVLRFDGFDSAGSWFWFYFHGPAEQAVRETVLLQIQDCQIRRGSYFLSAATQSCASPNDGPTLLL